MQQSGDAKRSGGSPVKRVEFHRGNSRVVADAPGSPRTLMRRRVANTPIKYRAAQQQARKPSNPITRSRLLSSPTARPRQDEDDWQDIDPSREKTRAGLARTPGENNPRTNPNNAWPELKPPTTAAAPIPELKPEATNVSHSLAQGDSAKANAEGDNSFFSFSHTNTSNSFLRKIAEQSSKFRNWQRRSRWSDTTTTDFGHHPGSGTNAATKGDWQSFLLDPKTPALLAMYVQVGFNAIMVMALLYAVAVFYTTVRNDVNMKVDEYSMEIVAEMAHCSQEYLRNKCEPSKRVPALAVPCREWEKCMERDPQIVGRAKISAETFGSIVEAFLKPIGIKSMVFLVCVFAGSFLLINAVFASRIGPRFSGQAYAQPTFAASGASMVPPPTSMPTHPSMPPSPQHHFERRPAQQSLGFMQHSQPNLSYHPAESFLYTPSHLGSPRSRAPQPLHPTLRSSPIQPRNEHEYLNYPY